MGTTMMMMLLLLLLLLLRGLLAWRVAAARTVRPCARRAWYLLRSQNAASGTGGKEAVASYKHRGTACAPARAHLVRGARPSIVPASRSWYLGRQEVSSSLRVAGASR